MLEALHTLLLCSLHPLAYSTFGDAQGLGYLPLFPALFFELVGPQAPALAPIASLAR